MRVRFAPSPTGHLHIGGIRTALFNWLAARNAKGTFILRIEDTDVKRSTPELAQDIFEGLKWLGLEWDEGPYYQSARLHQYRQMVEALVADRVAYRDFSQPGSSEDPTPYRDLSPQESKSRADRGESFAVRFRVPADRTVVFDDQVYGRIETESEQLEDFVLLRSDGLPTYHLGVVTDDLEMQITHVIRGADHLSNTPKQVLLYEALNEEPPIYAHVPLILGQDGKRLSKRHGATSIAAYRQQGILPEALLNYLALLGWSPGDDREFFERDELIEHFRIEKINKANAVFDPAKLEWMNGKYISAMRADSLAALVKEELRRRDIDWSHLTQEEFLARLDLLKSRYTRLTDFARIGAPYFSEHFEYEPAAVQKYLEVSGEQKEKLQSALVELRNAYAEMAHFDLDSSEAVLREVAAKYGLKTGQFIGAIRVGTSGSTVAPGIFDVLVTLGRERTLSRLDRLIEYLDDD